MEWDNHDARTVAWLSEVQWHRIVDTVVTACDLPPLPPLAHTAASISGETLPGGGGVRSASAPSRRPREREAAARPSSAERQRGRIHQITSRGGAEPYGRAPARGQPVGAGQYESQAEPPDLRPPPGATAVRPPPAPAEGETGEGGATMLVE